LFICPKYTVIRHKFISDYILPTTEDEYLSFWYSNLLCEKMIINVYAYVKEMLSLREN